MEIVMNKKTKTTSTRLAAAVGFSWIVSAMLFVQPIALAVLMVSHVPYDAMPRFTFHDSRKNLF